MKTTMLAMFSCISIMLGLTGCTSGPQEISNADKEAIRKTCLDAVAAFNSTKDYSAYTSTYYDEQAEVLMPNMDPIQGREAILNLLKTFGDINVEYNITRIDGKGDLAYVYGKYTISFPGGGADHGKYVEIWRKKQDKWQVNLDISNSSVPMKVDSVKM